MQRSKLLWLIGLVAALLLVAACAAPAGPAATTGETGEPAAAAGEPVRLRLSTTAEPSTLDPNLAEDFFSITPIEQMFLGLTNLNNETGEVGT